MSTAFLQERPPRMKIVHVATETWLDVQFNPQEVTEAVAANYERAEIVGHPGKELQYKGTDNPTIDFDLYWDAKSTLRQPHFGHFRPYQVEGLAESLPLGFIAAFNLAADTRIEGDTTRQIDAQLNQRVSQLSTVRDAQRFLMACCYPTTVTREIRGSAPSRLLFVWPRMWVMSCRLLSISTKHTRFNRAMRSTLATSTIKLECDWIDGYRVTFDDIFRTANGVFLP